MRPATQLRALSFVVRGVGRRNRRPAPDELFDSRKLEVGYSLTRKRRERGYRRIPFSTRAT
jgi:hypothetical protein